MNISGKSTLIFAAAVFLIFLQNSYAENRLKIRENDSTNLSIDSSEADSTIVDETFISKPFDLDTITVKSLRKAYSKYISIKKEAVHNVHVKNQTDTLLTVRIKNSEFIFYKIPGQELLESATINDPVIKLSRKISVGISKEEFKQRFNQLKQWQQLPPTIAVSGEEGEAYIIFTFDKQKLKKIEFVGYVD